MLASLALALLGGSAADDPRAGYDVLAYRIDLTVDPRARRIEGTVGVEAKVGAQAIASLVLDLDPQLELGAVQLLAGALDGTRSLAGTPLRVRREGRQIVAEFAEPQKPGARVALAIAYGGTPVEPNSFEGFHWKKSSDGQPWIDVACQGTGSSSWWPCKDSFWHPEDKPERTWINLRVPAGLSGIANGHLVAKEQQGAWDLFRWQHDYPCETYALSIYVGAYTEVATTLEIAGHKLDFIYWVLPEDAAKARLQFEDVPAMLETYSEAFGEYPFAKSKFALVESSYWGMEHSSCVAYGSSFPKWCAQQGAPDRYAEQNRFFDYILVHESAHEWWGNAVSARSWDDFWIHEGFATYAESLYVERVLGEEPLLEFWERLRPLVGAKDRLCAGGTPDSGAAYSGALYHKGAWVLHTLRWYVDDDELWWKTLREFNAQYRYKNAGTDDFRALLERNTGKKWERFFRAWFQGSGYPELEGRVYLERDKVQLEIENRASDTTQFEVPILLEWRDGKERHHERVMLAPGTNKLEFACKSKPADLAAHGWEHVLGRHKIKVE